MISNRKRSQRSQSKKNINKDIYQVNTSRIKLKTLTPSQATPKSTHPPSHRRFSARNGLCLVMDHYKITMASKWLFQFNFLLQTFLKGLPSHSALKASLDILHLRTLINFFPGLNPYFGQEWALFGHGSL